MQNILGLQQHHWNASWNYTYLIHSGFLFIVDEENQRIQTPKPHTSLQQLIHDRLLPTKMK